MERNVPGVFKAAGLIVPDPSISPPPIPFIDVEAGSGVEYMVASVSALLVCRTDRAGARKRTKQVDGGW